VKKMANRMAVRDVHPEEITNHRVADILRPLQQEKVLDLETFLGTEFSEWTTVFPERAAAATPGRGRG
jgi:hypothetical protein